LLLQKIKTEKTAKIAVKGNLDSDKIKYILIALHGYGQLSEYFIRNFNFLDENKFIVIVPEALNRFYLKGFSGNVGASWMTKVEREDEIKDQTTYLNNIVQLYKNEKWFGAVKKVVLGFSQGTATAVRWLINSDFSPTKIILWGGAVPKDADFDKVKTLSEKSDLNICIGTKDEFISVEKVNEVNTLLSEKKIKYNLTLYEGEHKIYKNVLKKIL
jgi:predicted esterase